MNKKVRWGIVLGTALLILGVVNFMIHESNYNKQVEAVAKKQSNRDQVVEEIKKQINSLYLDDAKEFLQTEISQEQIDLLEINVNKYLESSQAFSVNIENLRKNDRKKYQFNVNNLSALQNEVKAIQHKFKAQNEVNHLFQSPYLSGASENEEVIIIDDLTAEELQKVKENHYQDKADETKKFQSAINKGIEISQKQVDQITKVQKMINELYPEGKVTDQADRDTFDSLKKEVEEIKNEKSKNSFRELLKGMEEGLNEKEQSKEAEEVNRQEDQQLTEQSEEIVNTNNEEAPANDTTQNVVEAPTTQPSTPIYPTEPPVSPDLGGTNNSNNNSTGSNAGGNSSGSTGGSSTTPTPPVPEKPYALNPYTGSGSFYGSYGAAVEAARAEASNPNSNFSGYTIYTEIWSNGTEKYYLEFY